MKARCGELEDILNISMVLLPSKLADNKRLSEGLYINMGQDHCYFTDPLIRKTWLPDQPYRPGSWGYVDGNLLIPGREVLMTVYGMASEPI